MRSVRGGGGRTATAPSRDAGQVTLLVLVDLLLAVGLVTVVTDVTAVHLARTQLLDTADAVALDASDALAAGSGTVAAGRALPVTDADVRRQAVADLRRQPAPDGTRDVHLAGAAAGPDGSATVSLTGTVRLPLLAPVVAAWSGGVRVRVVSTARAVTAP